MEYTYSLINKIQEHELFGKNSLVDDDYWENYKLVQLELGSDHLVSIDLVSGNSPGGLRQWSKGLLLRIL